MEFGHPQSLIGDDFLFVFLLCDLCHTFYLRIFRGHVFSPWKQTTARLVNDFVGKHL